MKFLVAFVALVTVASASLHKPYYETPSIAPAMVEDFPAVGPAMVDHEYEKPAFGPALIDFPVNEAGSPVVVGPVPAGASPLVQIIVNVAKPAAEANVVANPPKPEGLDLSLFQPRH